MLFGRIVHFHRHVILTLDTCVSLPDNFPWAFKRTILRIITLIWKFSVDVWAYWLRTAQFYSLPGRVSTVVHFTVEGLKSIQTNSLLSIRDVVNRLPTSSSMDCWGKIEFRVFPTSQQAGKIVSPHPTNLDCYTVVSGYKPWVRSAWHWDNTGSGTKSGAFASGVYLARISAFFSHWSMLTVLTVLINSLKVMIHNVLWVVFFLSFMKYFLNFWMAEWIAWTHRNYKGTLNLIHMLNFLVLLSNELVKCAKNELMT